MNRKIKLLLSVLLVLFICILCFALGTSSGTQKGDQGQGDHSPENNDNIGVVYDAVVTYVVTFVEEEPITFEMTVREDGKAVIPHDIGDTDDTIWSGWLTEDGNQFGFNTVITEDITLTCSYLPDGNNNGIEDGTAADPMVIYQFLHANGFVMQTKTFFGLDTDFQYDSDEYQYPSDSNDGKVFIGWRETRSYSEDNGTITIALTPNFAADRNNNEREDGSTDDPYIYYVFLKEDGSVLETIEWLTGDVQVNTENVIYSISENQQFFGWKESVSINDQGYTEFTYTPQLAADESSAS